MVEEKNPLNIRKNHFLVVNLNFIQNISNSIENRVEKVFWSKAVGKIYLKNENNSVEGFENYLVNEIYFDAIKIREAVINIQKNIVNFKINKASKVEAKGNFNEEAEKENKVN